jgi:hypothetical protein
MPPRTMKTSTFMYAHSHDSIAKYKHGINPDFQVNLKHHDQFELTGLVATSVNKAQKIKRQIGLLELFA